MMKRILITGSNFNNKGAQSMLFITIDELKKRIPNCELFFATDEELDIYNDLAIKTVYYNYESVDVALERASIHGLVFKRIIKNTIKRLIGRKTISIRRIFELKELMKSIDLEINISGFGASSKWGVSGSQVYLDNIRLAKKYNVPIVLLPQSFGPFDYTEKGKEQLLRDINTLMRYPVIVYAREKDGYNLLTKTFNLTNVIQSDDIVLQNISIDLNNIFISYPTVHSVKVEENSVAIIPNKQCLNHGNKRALIEIYKTLISTLLKSNKNIYIIRHSKEDLKLCEDIKRLFKDEVRIHLIKREFSCVEFDKLIKQFDYAICSRFHGIVHSYRNGIPCLILGWAKKYEELSDRLHQEGFAFDITDNITDQDLSNMNKALLKMNNTYNEQRNIIMENINIIRESNCFEDINKWFSNQE